MSDDADATVFHGLIDVIMGENTYWQQLHVAN